MDTNGSSGEGAEVDAGNAPPVEFDEFKKKATIIVEEYFAADDVPSAADELRDLGCPCYHYYFVKKLLSMAMDRHDKEKEMAAVLLSMFYTVVIGPAQLYEGFGRLVDSCDDLYVDIPDVVDVLALFIARAVVDDILPPAFLTKHMASLPEGSKGMEAVKRAEKSYLSAPLHAEAVLRRWSGSKSTAVEDVKTRISSLLAEYVASGDRVEACRCIKDLKLPFFHHEIVKRALILAMERRHAQGPILDLLRHAGEEGLINASQMTKGFNRLIDVVDDLCLDIPGAREHLQPMISAAASQGWLCTSSLTPLPPLRRGEQPAEDEEATEAFKARAGAVILEYFLTGDILEAVGALEAEDLSASRLNAIFVKKLVMLAMDRKNREREMASMLLSSLPFSPDDVVSGFVLLAESAEDSALDIPGIEERLAMFLARGVVDEVLAPRHLEEIGAQCEGGPDSLGGKALEMARCLLRSPLSGERILRCWGGGGSSRTTGWEIEDVKDKIGRLLEEYDAGGDVHEACRCVKELGMPFFHHEVVKKALVTLMEKKGSRLWGLLQEGFATGLITTYQMAKGFERVADCIDDLALDLPCAKQQFAHYVERAMSRGWLDSSFSSFVAGCSE